MHIPLLTVRETLDFAARCQGAAHRPGAPCAGSCAARASRAPSRGKLKWDSRAPSVMGSVVC